jgi:hypothetical protein
VYGKGQSQFNQFCNAVALETYMQNPSKWQKMSKKKRQTITTSTWKIWSANSRSDEDIHAYITAIEQKFSTFERPTNPFFSNFVRQNPRESTDRTDDAAREADDDAETTTLTREAKAVVPRIAQHNDRAECLF